MTSTFPNQMVSGLVVWDPLAAFLILDPFFLLKFLFCVAASRGPLRFSSCPQLQSLSLRG